MTTNPQPSISRTARFPTVRPRGSRHHPLFRDLVRETTLTVHDLILPLSRPGHGIKKEIASMPGNYQLSVDRLVEEVGAALDLGVRAFILFGIPTHKDATGSSALDDEGIVQQALRALRETVRRPRSADDRRMFLRVHRSRPLRRAERDDRPARPRQRRDAAAAGGAMRQPRPGRGRSGGAERHARRHGRRHPRRPRRGRVRPRADHELLGQVRLGLLRPFRDAAESPPQFGDRSSYQMDPANSDEALREVALDLAEGADIIMVKPALAYLDIIRRVKERFGVPVAAYNVSGEFAMVKAAAQKGWIDERRVALEILTGIKRAGADMILTYFALDAARWLAGERPA